MSTRPIAGSLLGARITRLIELWRKSGKPALDPEFPSALSSVETRALGAALLALQRGLTGGRTLAGKGYMEDGELLGAYLLYYWPVSYMQVSLVLAERPGSPRRVLDIGSGPGPASAAVVDALNAGERLDELLLLDGSRKALDLGATILASGANSPARIETMQMDLESGMALPKPALPGQGFDLIIFGHILNELWARGGDAPERRLDLVKRAAERLSPGGRILLMEPALLSTCRSLIALRDQLAAASWAVLAPCPGSYPCPALAAGAERSCHAQSPWEPAPIVAALAKAAGLDRDSVKFTYFLLSPPSKTGAAPQPGPEETSPLRRVVSDPMLNKAGRLRYVLCGSRKLETISARADDGDARAKGFMELRRGDTFIARGLEPRQGGGFGLLPDSELIMQGRAPEAST